MSRVPSGSRRPRALGLAIAATLVAALALSAAPVDAAPLVVANPGFESPVIPADGGFIPGAPTSWVQVGSGLTGTFNPQNGGFNINGDAHGGANTAYVVGDGQTPTYLSQIVAAPLSNTVTYRVRAWVNRRNDRGAVDPGGNYAVQLWNVTDNRLLCSDSAPVPTLGSGWVQAECLYLALPIDDLDVLQIRLVAQNGPNSVDTQMQFDDVTLEYFEQQRPPPPTPPPPPPPPPPVERQLCYKVPATVDLTLGEVPTAGPDRIAGTPGADVINGLGGNDIICGRGGNDRINGGAGNDTMFGSAGNDSIFGGVGNDIMRGRTGVDDCHGGPGSDVASECETTTGVP